MTEVEGIFDLRMFTEETRSRIIADFKERLEALVTMDSGLTAVKGNILSVKVYGSYPWTTGTMLSTLETMWENIIWKFVGSQCLIKEL